MEGDGKEPYKRAEIWWQEMKALGKEPGKRVEC